MLLRIALRASVALLFFACAAGAQSLGNPRSLGGVMVQPVAHGTTVFYGTGGTIEIRDFPPTGVPTLQRFVPDPPFEGPISGLAVINDELVVQSYDELTRLGSLRAYSIVQPTRPLLLAKVDATPTQLTVAYDRYVYTLDVNAGFSVLDAQHLALIGHAAGFDAQVVSARTAANRLYVTVTAADADAVDVYDLSDAAHPAFIAQFPLGSSGNIVAATDSGYVVSLGDVVTVYDMRDPANVVNVATLPREDAVTAALRADTLYLFGGEMLTTYDFSVPAAPVLTGHAPIDTRDLRTLTATTSAFIVTTTDARGIDINLGVNGTPMPHAEFDAPSDQVFNANARDNRYAYQAGAQQAFRIVDAITLKTVGSIDADDANADALLDAHAITLIGSVALVATYAGLYAIDVSDVSNPRVVDVLPIDNIGRLAVAQGRVYLSTRGTTEALAVIDVSNPRRLELRGTLNGFYQFGVASGHFGFFYLQDAQERYTLQIVDTTDFEHPQLIASYVPCDGANVGPALGTNGGLLAIGCANGDVEFIDVRNPPTPILAGVYPSSSVAGNTYSIVSRGAHFYLGTDAGIDELDLSTPARPRRVLHYATGVENYALAIAPVGSLLAMTASEGMFFLDCVAHDPLLCGDRTPFSSTGHSEHERPRR